MNLIDPTQKEIREEQKAFLKDKGFKYKLEYFKDYYLKMVLLALAALALLVSLVVSTVTNKQSLCNVLFINCQSSPDVEDFIEYAGIDPKKNTASFDSGYYINKELADNTSYVNAQKMIAVVAANDAEAVVGDYETVYQYAASEFYADLNDLFSKDELEALGDKVIYYEYMDEDGNLTGEKAPLFINVADSPFLIKNNCYSSDTVLLAFVVNSQRPEMAMTFYHYLYE